LKYLLNDLNNQRQAPIEEMVVIPVVVDVDLIGFMPEAMDDVMSMCFMRRILPDQTNGRKSAAVTKSDLCRIPERKRSSAHILNV
jgi:hypothetical protein